MNILEQDTTDQVVIDENKKYYDDLVGEGKKFKDNEALARSKFEADSYIEILKKRQDELRDDYLKMREEVMAKAKLEELISQLDKKSAVQEPSDNMTTVKPELPDLDKLFSDKITQHELSKKKEANLQAVKEKLIERFGKNYQNTVKQQIEDLGISEDVFNQMAQNYPNMVYKSLGLDQPLKTEGFQAPPRSSFQGPPQSGKKERTWSYYQELKRTDPKLYYNPKIANQMQEDYQRLGAAFEDGDFNS